MSEINKEAVSPLEISKLARTKRGVSLVPTIAISMGIILLLGIFLYLTYFKNIGKTTTTIETKTRPEIIKKVFSFKKPLLEVPIKINEEPQLEILNNQEQKVSLAPVFKKYKSLPIAKGIDEASDANTKNSNAKSAEAGSEKDIDIPVVAEKMTIDPNFLLPEGTYIPCSLTSKFNSDITGRITCTVAEDVYSANGLVKLIEKGTRAIGTYQGGSLKQGMGRMFVIWTKLITPDFKCIKLADSQVVGRLGEAGIDGFVNSHFFQRFGSAITLSAVKDLAKMRQQPSQKTSTDTVVNINTMSETKDAFVSIVDKMLESSINIAPTMYKNQGDIVGIMVGRDIDFSQVYRLKIHR